MLEIIYKDEFIVAINKPHGLLVHRSRIANDAVEFAIQLLRDQLEMKVFPVHRLDRKTSGVLLFAFSQEVNSILQQQFMNHLCGKVYESIVRGHTALSGTIDYALTNDKGKEQAAVTHFETLNQSELDFPSFNYETSRYSFLKLRPETGRFHQLRKHLAHIRNPIIGDRPHGCNKQNKLFLERFQMNNMMLHASELTFSHPITLEQIVLTANRSSEFDRMLAELSLNVP